MSRFDSDVETMRAGVLAANRRAENLAQRIADARHALLMGGQSAEVRCRAALAVLEGEAVS